MAGMLIGQFVMDAPRRTPPQEQQLMAIVINEPRRVVDTAGNNRMYCVYIVPSEFGQAFVNANSNLDAFQRRNRNRTLNPLERNEERRLRNTLDLSFENMRANNAVAFVYTNNASLPEGTIISLNQFGSPNLRLFTQQQSPGGGPIRELTTVEGIQAYWRSQHPDRDR